MRSSNIRRRLFAALALLGVSPPVGLFLLGLAPTSALWIVPAALVAAYLVAARLALPLESLRDAALRMGSGEEGARPLLPPETEEGAVEEVLWQLAAQVAEERRRQDERVEARTAALARKADQMRAVGQVGQQVAAVLEPDALLHFVVRVMRGTFGYDLVAVLQRHGEHLVLAAGAARGIEEFPVGRVFPLSGPGAPPLAACMAGDELLHNSPSSLAGTVAARAELAVPVRLGGRTLGVIAVQSLVAGSLDQEDLVVARTIAGQVAVALENARLFAAERQLRDLSITEERNRMAREIHDTLAQGFMGIIMQLRAMQAAATPEQAELYREQAETLARESLQEARRSVWNLRPLSLEGSGLAGALQSEVESLEQRAALRGALQTVGDIDRVPPQVQAALLRIAQESLHNAVKYARATSLVVRLAVTDGWAELQVTDDGVGFDPAAAGSRRPTPGDGGFGLAGMAERARLLGGTLLVESAPGAGCRITARIPVTGGK